MNKLVKILLIVISATILLTGLTYAGRKMYEKVKEKATMTPIFTGELGNTDTNSVWVGTFQIAWNEFMNRVGDNIKFEDGPSILADELKKKTFTKDMISSEDYYVRVEKTTPELKASILKDIDEKFKMKNESILDQINFQPAGESYTMYAMLSKDFEFEIQFDKLGALGFGDTHESVEYFGINNASEENINDNVDVLFYNNNEDFSVKIKTKGNDELILYKTKSTKSFNDIYKEITEKSNAYNGKKYFTTSDELKVPYINVNTVINYNELCGRYIEGTNGMYIANALQNVKFNLNERGGNLTSEAGIESEYLNEDEETRCFYFNDDFVIFMKEKDKSMPYFALKVDNFDILVKENENK